MLLAFAAPALGMRLGFPDPGNDPPDTMTRQGYDLNTQGFGRGTNGPLVIAAELPDRAATSSIDSFAERLRGEPGVAFVAEPRINAQGDAAIVTVIPRAPRKTRRRRIWSTGCARTSYPSRSARLASLPTSGA